MGDADQQKPAAGPPVGPDKKLGSEEAGLHEVSGSTVSMPEWADSLSRGVTGAGSRVDVDLAKRLQEEEARRIRERAEAARRAAEETARQKAAQEAARHAPVRPAASPEPRKVSKWPSLLVAFVVIMIGAFVGQRVVSSDAGNPSAGAATPYPVVTAAPATPAAAPAAPTTTTHRSQGAHVDTYTVKPGDTLESIAKQFNRTPVEISQANGAYGGLIRIRVGQVINIP